MKVYYVYILKCADGSYYTGVTDDIEKRVNQHQSGYDPKCYTYRRRPVELVFVESFQNPLDAISREKQIKGWSRRKKEALIRGDWEAIKDYARSKRK